MIGASEWRLGLCLIFRVIMPSCMSILMGELLYFVLCLRQVLKCLNQFVQNFPGLVESQFMGEFFILTYHGEIS